MTKQGSPLWLVAMLLLLSPIASRADPDPLNQWQASGGFGGEALSAAFGNGRFFVTSGSQFAAVSPMSQLLTSTDGLNWQVNPLPGFARGVTIADDTIIIVGAKTNHTALVMTSSDGTNWVDLPGPTNIVLNGICHGGDKYISWGIALTSSYGGPSVNLVSSNALDWLVYTNYQPNDQPYFTSMTFGDGTFAGIAYIFGEGGYTFSLLTSTNGFTWTQRAGRGYSSGIAFGNHTFVGPNVISTNGVDFYPLSIPTLTISTITFGNGTFLAAGWEGTYATSTNGSDWNAYNGSPWGWDDFQIANVSVFGNSRFILSDTSILFRSGDVSIPALSGRRTSPGFGLSLKGEINRPYQIEISDDLQNWSELMTVTNPLPITEYIDPAPIDSTNRFYRAYMQR